MIWLINAAMILMALKVSCTTVCNSIDLDILNQNFWLFDLIPEGWFLAEKLENLNLNPYQTLEVLKNVPEQNLYRQA